MEDNFWSRGEADAWFERNRLRLKDPSARTDVRDLLSFIDRQGLLVSRVLEVGCSSGLVVEAIAQHTGAAGFGVDLSDTAIRNGRARLEKSNANVELAVGSATNLPFENVQFDLVVAGFFLYAIPQSELFKSFAEIDRVLKDGGFLAVLDFAFPHFISVPYRHEPDATVYKRRYIEMLTSSNHYSVVFSRTYSKESSAFPLDPNDRINFTILYKEPVAYLRVNHF